MSNTVSNAIYVPYRTDVECHAIAEAFLREHGFYSPYRDNSAPYINVENLANKAGYFVQPIPGLSQRHGVKAAIVRIGAKRLEIHVDLYHYDHHKNTPFSIAEELGHIILHAHLFANARDVADVIKLIESLSNDTRKRIEIQAKSLASCLLLPDHKLRPFAVGFCKEKERVIKEEELINHTSGLSSYLEERFVEDHGLSSLIFSRALRRETPTPIIDELSALLRIGEPSIKLPGKIENTSSTTPF